MASRFRTPEELERMSQLRQQAELLETFAAYSVTAGLITMLVASVVLLQGPRRYFASASLICLVVMVFDVFTSTPHDEIFTVCDAFPERDIHNGPLVDLLAGASALGQLATPCRGRRWHSIAYDGVSRSTGDDLSACMEPRIRYGIRPQPVVSPSLHIAT